MEDDFERLLQDYLDTRNPDLADVELDLAPGNADYGIDHAWEKHSVSEAEVHEVLFELPSPERKRSEHDRQPQRTLYWGTTRGGRELTVVVIESAADGQRQMTLVTAFPETEEQWRTRK